jgi:tetratricopeptide (TPR) repeat protein
VNLLSRVRSRTGIGWGVMLAFAIASGTAIGQEKVHCPDGDRNQLDVEKLKLRYQATKWEATLSALGKMTGALTVEPKTLQVASEATQQWNQFLQALVMGYNGCAITKAQYNEAIKVLIPGLAGDGQKLQQIRRSIEQGRKVEQAQLDRRLTAYVKKLERLDQISRTSIVQDIRKEIARAKVEIIQSHEKGTAAILREVRELKEQVTKSPLATPQEVKAEISEIKKSLLAKAGEADLAYNRGYRLIEEYRAEEAVSYLEQALSVIKLPEFYLALGHAYSEIPRPRDAERVLREGLELAEREGKERQQASLSNDLALVLRDKGDLQGAQRYTERALKIAEKVYGPEHPKVAAIANNVGLILNDRGDLEGAQRYAERALEIDEKVYGPEHPNVAIDANNLGQVLQVKGDLEGAQRYTERALKIDEKVYGPEHPNVATFANNLGLILKAKGKLEEAQRYAERALKIDEKVYGPEHPKVAIRASNLGAILQAKGDLEGAQRYTERALDIFMARFGTNHSYAMWARTRLQSIQAALKERQAKER